jgi:hypothetical protein
MIMQATGLGMGVGRLSRHLRGVGVITMRNVGLETKRHIEVPPVDCVLQLPLPGTVVGVLFDLHCVAAGVEVTC